MFWNSGEIDYERLREDLLDECAAGYLAGGMGSMLIVECEVERATPDQLVRIAKEFGFNLRRYTK